MNLMLMFKYKIICFIMQIHLLIIVLYTLIMLNQIYFLSLLSLLPTNITAKFSFEFYFNYFIHLGKLSYDDLLVISKTINAPDAPL